MESKTIIIATIGPASSTKEILIELIKHRMDMARLNFSWGTHEEDADVIKLIRQVSKELKVSIPIIQDLSGPRVQDKSGHHFGGNDNVTTDKDIADLSFGIKQDVDYIAQSFVGNAGDIVNLRKLISEKGGRQKIIAKIERKEAVENLASIIKEADAIMIARGDLGNEYPLEEIPFIQHRIIKETKKSGKMVIVATQMLESMVENPTPTRAEVSDVAYAILDGADGVMLSEESAKGKYPVEAVAMMEKIALVAEKNLNIIKIGQ
ncbi:MAG TPA: pyruvate kinase [Candidatus Paceibacterota bacterium]|nr:pyruvate kinase [Candidatus Paceibacterota bacterium]